MRDITTEDLNIFDKPNSKQKTSNANSLNLLWKLFFFYLLLTKSAAETTTSKHNSNNLSLAEFTKLSAYFTQINTYVQENNPDQAVQILFDAEANFPNNVDILNRLAAALQHTLKIKESIPYYQRAYELNSLSYTAISALADHAFQHAKDYVTAEKYYQIALSINAEDLHSKNHLKDCKTKLAYKDQSNKSATTNDYGQNNLHISVLNNNLDLVKQTLKDQAQVNQQDVWGNTPAHYAAAKDSNIMKTLLKSGANLYIQNIDSYSPIEYAFHIYAIDTIQEIFIFYQSPHSYFSLLDLWIDAVKLFQTKKFSDALTKLQWNAIQSNLAHEKYLVSYLHFWRSICLLKLNKPEQARQEIDNAIDLYKSVDYYLHKLEIASNYIKNQFGSILKIALENFPKNLSLKKELVNYYLENGFAEHAISVCEQIIKNFPNECDILLILARYKIREKNYSEAKQYLIKASNLQPEEKIFKDLLAQIKQLQNTSNPDIKNQASDLLRQENYFLALLFYLWFILARVIKIFFPKPRLKYSAATNPSNKKIKKPFSTSLQKTEDKTTLTADFIKNEISTVRNLHKTNQKNKSETNDEISILLKKIETYENLTSHCHPKEKPAQQQTVKEKAAKNIAVIKIAFTQDIEQSNKQELNLNNDNSLKASILKLIDERTIAMTLEELEKIKNHIMVSNDIQKSKKEIVKNYQVKLDAARMQYSYYKNTHNNPGSFFKNKQQKANNHQDPAINKKKHPAMQQPNH